MTLSLLTISMATALVQGQSSTDYQPKLPDYTRQSIIDPIPTAPLPPPPIPIDGGAVFLLATGVGYGLKRLSSHKKNN